jgi:hypothetical protein
MMLEALLEPISSSDSGESETSAERLDEEDRLTIEKCTILFIFDLTVSYSKYSETSRRTS